MHAAMYADVYAWRWTSNIVLLFAVCYVIYRLCQKEEEPQEEKEESNNTQRPCCCCCRKKLTVRSGENESFASDVDCSAFCNVRFWSCGTLDGGKDPPPASEILGPKGTVQGDLISRSEAKNEIFEKVSKFPENMRQ